MYIAVYNDRVIARFTREDNAQNFLKSKWCPKERVTIKKMTTLEYFEHKAADLEKSLKG